MTDNGSGQQLSQGPARTSNSGPESKVCGRCRKAKPPTEFYRNSGSKDGREWCCKACKREYNRDYLNRSENPKATEKRQHKAEFFFAHPTWTLRECADALRCAPAAIQRAVAVEDPDKSRRIRRRQQAAEIRAEEEIQRRLATAKPCLVCGELVLRGPTFKTCSSRCTELWRNGRLRLSGEEHEKHRQAQAVSILRSPEKYRDVQVKWAKRMLSADPPPPNRRYEVPNSLASQLEEQARRLQRETLPKPKPQEDIWIDYTEFAS